MSPFYKAEIIRESALKYEDAVKLVPGLTKEAYEEQIERSLEGECFKNTTYQVIRKELRPSEHGFGPARIVHLSIKRLDKASIHDWRDLQEIKNQLVHPNCEGFEIYPSEQRVVDTANQYHLWVFMEQGMKLPIGFSRRLVTNESVGGAVQRQR